MNVATGRGLPTTVAVDDKLWLFGGAGSSILVAEIENSCFLGSICSTGYGWTLPQDSFRYERCWVTGTGQVFIFPAPFGAIIRINGLFICDSA